MASVNYEPVGGPVNTPSLIPPTAQGDLQSGMPETGSGGAPSSGATASGPSTPRKKPARRTHPLHRIQTVRLQQGVSLRSVARNTGVDTRTLRAQEQESCDLTLTDLYRWQEALDVPVADLLVEPEPSLSRPVFERARLIRIMKTAAAILQNANTPGLQRMAQTLVDQLIELMPELRHISPWHTYGQRRSLDEQGRIVEQQISDDIFQSWEND